MLKFLLSWEERGPHWYVRQAIKVAHGATGLVAKMPKVEQSKVHIPVVINQGGKALKWLFHPFQACLCNRDKIHDLDFLSDIL